MHGDDRMSSALFVPVDAREFEPQIMSVGPTCILNVLKRSSR